MDYEETQVLEQEQGQEINTSDTMAIAIAQAEYNRCFVLFESGAFAKRVKIKWQ